MKYLALFMLVTTTNIYAALPNALLFGTKNQQFYNQHKIQKVFTVKHYLIDGGRDFEAQISQGLSKDPIEAMRQVKLKFEKNKNTWDRQAKQGWQGSVNAQSLNIEKVPAISFDSGKTVIYGVLDVLKAYKAYKTWEHVGKK